MALFRFKIKAVFILPAFLAAALFLVLSYRDSAAGEGADACFQRCEAFTGQARYRCMQTCLNATRKNEKSSSPTAKEKFQKCEKFCASYQGVDQVRCLRICLDKYEEFERQGKQDTDIQAEPEKNTTETDLCIERCSVLNEPHRSACIEKCRKNEEQRRRHETNVW
jgi:hypothetical protein